MSRTEQSNNGRHQNTDKTVMEFTERGGLMGGGGWREFLGFGPPGKRVEGLE